MIREFSRKLGEIQNASLGESRIRDLNDELNNLIKSKNQLETRIVELGGYDYRIQGAQLFDSFGRELAGQKGYKYFGAAKDLPGVREIFEQRELEKSKRRTRRDINKNIKPDYFEWKQSKEMIDQEEEADKILYERISKEWTEIGDSTETVTINEYTHNEQVVIFITFRTVTKTSLIHHLH